MVIVVLGILAAIAIVSYSYIQRKATISGIELGASSYMKAIKVYESEYGHKPLEGESTSYAYGSIPVYGYCVGDSKKYINPEKGCGGWFIHGKPTNVNKYRPTDGFHKEIMKVINGQASPRFDCFYIAPNGSCARGFVYLPQDVYSAASKLDGKNRSFFGYFLPGKNKCTLSGELAKTYNQPSSTIIRQSYSYYSSIKKDYTFATDKFTLCLYAI